jgi:hypothetical protein
MKISKIYEELKEIVLGKNKSDKKKEKLDNEITHKISKTKMKINEAKNDEEVKKLKAKLVILEKLNRLSSAE